MTEVLARRDRALTPEETEELLRDRLGDAVQHAVREFGVFTLWITQQGWAQVAAFCRDEPLLAYDLFDNLFAVDAREDGFDVVAILYSTSTGNRIALRTRCEGGREAPTCPSLTEVYRGANWMERETWDMFGIDFPGHPSVSPRILTVENFEGWPLRKDFHLSSRAAKNWPGVKEPAELDEDGKAIHRTPQLGDAPGPYDLDKAMGEQTKLSNPKPAPETEEGAEVEDLAPVAEHADDSDKVLAGDTEEVLDEVQQTREDVEVDEADAASAGVADEAKRKAEQRRKDQAEARARKAAERTEQAEQDEQDGDGETNP